MQLELMIMNINDIREKIRFIELNLGVATSKITDASYHLCSNVTNVPQMTGSIKGKKNDLIVFLETTKAINQKKKRPGHHLCRTHRSTCGHIIYKKIITYSARRVMILIDNTIQPNTPSRARK